ncbi:DUF402 domain-containing protein [Thermomicrobium sp. 4228-Ro]|uniref:DUF402 domain-containing protein n=1 Tax=Thermomicrobium sp. 4228-Ro TaxID=2993937 RepID=UPI0022493F21|nr:DUF402 domain-containing protein [Thermomicrobium sp. 4228-Ro]MCX2727550.1 DUF402 domain-containing protein [Thermomicrobium sp. 4228-Ro]
MNMAPYRELTVVKLDPLGKPVARYRGTTQAGLPGWVVLRARWSLGTVVSGPIRFECGDELVEYFSLIEPINAFALYDAAGRFKGWYTNVACPAFLVENELYWRDLYIDVVVNAEGHLAVLDEEELETSGLRERDPDAYACILAARDRLLAALRSRSYPFDQHPPLPLPENLAEAVQ